MHYQAYIRCWSIVRFILEGLYNWMADGFHMPCSEAIAFASLLSTKTETLLCSVFEKSYFSSEIITRTSLCLIKLRKYSNLVNADKIAYCKNLIITNSIFFLILHSFVEIIQNRFLSSMIFKRYILLLFVVSKRAPTNSVGLIPQPFPT